MNDLLYFGGAGFVAGLGLMCLRQRHRLINTQHPGEQPVPITITEQRDAPAEFERALSDGDQTILARLVLHYAIKAAHAEGRNEGYRECLDRLVESQDAEAESLAPT